MTLLSNGFTEDDNNYVITIGTSDKVNKELKGLTDTHEDIMAFIRQSAQQMADFVNNSIPGQSEVLLTPTRRSRRSSVAPEVKTKRKSSTKGFPTRDPSVASVVTPGRRRSKRVKRSIIASDETLIAEISPKRMSNSRTKLSFDTEIQSSLPTEPAAEEEPLDVQTAVDMSVEEPDFAVVNQEVFVTETDENIELNVPTIQIESNAEIICTESTGILPTITSEKVAANCRLNESDTEWMTDDETDGRPKDCPAKKSCGAERTPFFDAISEPRIISSSSGVSSGSQSSYTSRESRNITSTESLAAKQAPKPRKKSQYFTPEGSHGLLSKMRTRLQTKGVDRKTPNAANKSSSHQPEAAIGRVGGSGVNSTAGKRLVTDSGGSIRSVARIARQTPDNKKKAEQTASALKKRREDEENRRQKLLASQEKERRAVENRRILIEQTVKEKRAKSQEKVSRVAELREQNARRESERQIREKEKRAELERKREAERRDFALQKANEVQRRKQLQEMKESAAQIRAQEEAQRRHAADRERLRERDQIEAIINKHNNSLKAGGPSTSRLQVVSVPAKHMASDLNRPDVPPVSEPMGAAGGGNANQNYNKGNKTFVVDCRETSAIAAEESGYELTPPPKESSDYDNYDISQLGSEDETDDEEAPRKRIPRWARGGTFIGLVHKQYNKSEQEVVDEVESVFQTKGCLRRFETDFQQLFPKIHPKYSKRTSSAIWDDSHDIFGSKSSLSNFSNN